MSEVVMSYVLSGKLDMPQGKNPNFNFPVDAETNEKAKGAAEVLLGMERRHYAITEAILKNGNCEVKKYPRMEKKSDVLVSI
jgi:hypothetical protein